MWPNCMFSKTSLNIWKFMIHVLLKPGLENLEHYFNSVWDECNCAVDWTFFGIAFLWDWNENWAFPVLWPLLSFPNLLAYWMQHLSSIISFRILNSSTGIPLPPLALFIVMLSKPHLTSHSKIRSVSQNLCPPVPRINQVWPPDPESWLIGKDPDAGKDWRQEKKGTTEDEMFGLYHRHDGHEFQ